MVSTGHAAVVGVFSDRAQANHALGALRSAGWSEDQLGLCYATTRPIMQRHDQVNQNPPIDQAVLLHHLSPINRCCNQELIHPLFNQMSPTIFQANPPFLMGCKYYTTTALPKMPSAWVPPVLCASHKTYDRHLQLPPVSHE